MSIVSTIKRFLYDWSRPSMLDASEQVQGKDCSVGCTVNVYERFFSRMNEGTWKGDAQTLECLQKVMDSINKYTYHVVKGCVQSGKSQLIIYYSAWMAYEQNMNVVVMLRNQTADIKSLKDKFSQFKGEKGFNDLEVIEFAKFFKENCIEEVASKFRESKKVFVMLGNSEQLEKLNNVVEASNGRCPFAMCIDELDLNEKQASTRFQHEFIKLKGSGNISHVIGVTGTALPVLFKRLDELSNEQVVRLKEPLNYKGIHNITFTTIDITKKDAVEKVMLNMLKSDYAFYDSNGERHPAILLVKDDRVKANQFEMMQTLVANPQLDKKWAVIVYNGDGLYVRLPGNRPFNSSIKPNGINECLQMLKESSVKDSLKYIAIISGDLANRGLSFVSKDYVWHLTHMIMCARPCSTGTNLVQYVRLCGCYNDDIPLEMFTSSDIRDELFAYDNLQERCVDKCEEPLIDEDQLRERLSKMKLDSACVVRRPIDTQLKVKYTNVSQYDKVMVGQKINAQTMKEAIEKVQEEFGKKPKVMVKKIRFAGAQTPENIKKIKYQLKQRYEIDKYINVIDESRYLHLYKNPFFVTNTYSKSMAMINKNGKDRTDVYVKQFTKESMSHGDLFLFETPSGIFLSDNIDKEELENMFIKYQLQV